MGRPRKSLDPNPKSFAKIGAAIDDSMNDGAIEARDAQASASPL